MSGSDLQPIGIGWDFHAPNRWDEHGRKREHDSCFTLTAVECRGANPPRKRLSVDVSRLTSATINLADELSLLVIKNSKIRTGLFWVGKPTHNLYLCINQSSTIDMNPACWDPACMQEREFLDLIGTKCPWPLLVWAIFFHILHTLTVFFHQMMSAQKQHVFPGCRVRVEAGLSMWDEVIIPCPTEIRDMVVSIRAA